MCAPEMYGFAEVPIECRKAQLADLRNEARTVGVIEILVALKVLYGVRNQLERLLVVGAICTGKEVHVEGLWAAAFGIFRPTFAIDTLIFEC